MHLQRSNNHSHPHSRRSKERSLIDDCGLARALDPEITAAEPETTVGGLVQHGQQYHKVQYTRCMLWHSCEINVTTVKAVLHKQNSLWQVSSADLFKAQQHGAVTLGGVM